MSCVVFIGLKSTSVVAPQISESTKLRKKKKKKKKKKNFIIAKKICHHYKPNKENFTRAVSGLDITGEGLHVAY